MGDGDKPAIESREILVRGFVGTQEQRRKRRGERQRDQSRDDHRDRDRHSKLAVELAGQPAEERDRHEHRGQREHDSDDRSRHLAHRLDRGIAGRQAFLAHDPLDVLQHDDRVVDDDADCEHHREQRERVDRIAEHIDTGEGTDQRHRDRGERNQRGAPTLQKQVDDQEYQHHRQAQRLQHFADRHLDEERRVVRNAVGQALGETLRELRHLLLDALGDVERVRAGREEDADERRGLAVHATDELVISRAQLDMRDIGEAHDRAVGIGPHDDLLELFWIGEPAAGSDGVDELLLLIDRRLADLACGKLRVLLVQRADDVRRRELELREPVGFEPHAHGVVLGTEDLHVGRARDALQLIEHVERHVVRREQVVEAAVGRVEREHLQKRRAAALDRDALPAHLLGQPRLDLLHAVVDVDRGDVDVGADLERDLDLHDAVRSRVRAHVDHVRHAVDRVFQRRRDGLFQRLRGGARIDRLNGHHRRRDLGILRDRQRAHRRQAGEHDKRRDDRREKRAVDEEAREHGVVLALISTRRRKEPWRGYPAARRARPMQARRWRA